MKKTITIILTLTFVLTALLGAIPFTVSAAPIVYNEIEPNNKVSAAGAIGNNYMVYGNSSNLNDTDYYTFVLEDSSMVTIDGQTDGLDLQVTVYLNNGSSFKNCKTLFPNSAKVLNTTVALEPGTYYLSFSRPGGDDYLLNYSFLLTIVKHEHTYDDNCDTTCNECSAKRSNPPHYFTDKNDTYCENCGKGCNHSFDNTCDNTCNLCGGFFEGVGHDYNPATCTDPKTCKVCGDKDGKALGHTGGTATCKVQAICTRCGNAHGSLNVNNHKNVKTINAVAATCSKTGLTAGKKCADCGRITVAQKLIEKKSHTYNNVTTKATVKSDGKIEKKCTVCGVVSGIKVIRKIGSVTLGETKYSYNGKAKTPTVIVKDSVGTKLKKNTDYTVKLASGRKNVGKYKVTVTFKGKYSGTKTLYFTINPAKTTVSKLTAGKKSIKVNITKKSTQVTGYEVQYSTAKTFKSAKTKTISSYKTTSTTLSKLSAKKTYYVRVRTYKTVNGKKYYSGWSTYKYTKTK